MASLMRSGASSEPAAKRISYPIFSRLLPVITAIREARGDREHRRELLAGLSGRVVEVGAGVGANFARYPREVAEVVAIEPEPYLREQAKRAAEKVSTPISVVDGDADHLPGDDGSFDAGVVSLVLCTVPDPERALTELFRVIRPDGELRFFEHVVAQAYFGARLQRLADATFWPHVAGGCHMARDTKANIERTGFVMKDCRCFSVKLARLMPPEPHLLGAARRP
jgi:ubiquinone/menaquinone biosynthesis C-methylase UbiE